LHSDLPSRTAIVKPNEFVRSKYLVQGPFVKYGSYTRNCPAAFWLYCEVHRQKTDFHHTSDKIAIRRAGGTELIE